MGEGILILAIFLVFVLIIFATSGIKIVQPYEQAIYMRLGKFVRVLDQGLNIVTPLINQVVKIDLRTEVMDVPKQEVITKDNSPVFVDAIISIKVTECTREDAIEKAKSVLRSEYGNFADKVDVLCAE